MKITKLYSDYQEEERLYSTGNDELDDLLERAFCEGYEYAQREFNSKAQKARRAAFDMIASAESGSGRVRVPVQKMLNHGYTPAQIAEANAKATGRMINRSPGNKGIHGSINAKGIIRDPKRMEAYLKDVPPEYKLEARNDLKKTTMKEIMERNKGGYYQHI